MKLMESRFSVTQEAGEVGAVLMRPDNAAWLFVYGHGAGVPMRHPFMEATAERLAKQRIATFRYQFPYSAAGRKLPDRLPVLIQTVRAAVDYAHRTAPDLPMLAGGKSLGARMSSLAAAESSLPHIRGLVFFGFPLHAEGKPSTDRADHLTAVPIPMLFLQGTRDPLADLRLLRTVCDRLGDFAELQTFEGADHSFRVPKKSGKTHEQVLDEICSAVDEWAAGLDAGGLR